MANDDPHEDFARNLAFWLAFRGAKAVDLARAIDQSTASVSRWLTRINAPDLRTAGKVAKFLKIPLEELYRENPEGRPEALVGASARTPEARRTRLLENLADELDLHVRVTPKKKS